MIVTTADTRRATARIIIYTLLTLALCVVAGAKVLAQAQGHTLLLVRANAGSYQIIGRRELTSPLPRALTHAAHQGWSFQALDGSGAVIHTGALPNPQIVRAEFSTTTGETEGVHLSDGNAVTFSIRVPQDSKTVVLYGVPVPTAQPLAAPPPGASAKSSKASKSTPPSAVLARIAL